MEYDLIFCSNQENARSLKQGSKMEADYQSLIWLLVTWLPYCLRKFGFDIWLLVSFNLQIYHLIGSKGRM